jgi:tRNA (mo5U34)-methyltransferase
MYEWDLTRAVTTPLLGPELPSVHQTRAEIIEPVVRAALTRAGPRARALDVRLQRGWFGHRLLEWGSWEVVAVEVRPENIHRADLIRDHFGLAPERLRLTQGDVYDMSPEAPGVFDVVLCLGLIYHLEAPIGALRVARSLTAGTCVVETQTTRQQQAAGHHLGADRSHDAARSDLGGLRRARRRAGRDHARRSGRW